MQTKRLGKTPFHVSKIGLGTVQFGIDYGFTKKKNQDQVDEILTCAKKNGVHFIDTAREYGDSEMKIGNYLSRHSHPFTIATKLKKIPAHADLLPLIYESVEQSLKNLQQSKLDLLQLHQTDPFILNNSDFWKVIAKLKEEKVISGFGVSVYDTDETAAFMQHHHLIDFFQVPFNIFDRRFAALENQFHHRKIGVISRSTFLKGLIPCSTAQLPNELKGLAPYKKQLNRQAEKLGLTPAELALLFVYQHTLTDSTILGVDSASELERNVSILKKSIPPHSFNGLGVPDLKLIDPRKWSGF